MKSERTRKVTGFLSSLIFHLALLFLFIYWRFTHQIPAEEFISVEYQPYLNEDFMAGLTPDGMPSADKPVLTPERNNATEAEKSSTKDPPDAETENTSVTVTEDKKVLLTEKESEINLPSGKEKKVVTETSGINKETKENIPGKSEGTGGSKEEGKGTINPGALFTFTGKGFSGQFKGQPRNPILSPLPEYSIQEEGSVTLKFKVYSDGSVGGIVMDITMQNNSPRFFQLAKDAMKKWKFNKSALTEQEGRITFHFKLR